MPYRCKFCSRPFIHFSEYRYHLKLHESSETSRSQNLQCYVCAEMFETPSDLVRHYTCHTDSVPSNIEQPSKPLQAEKVSFFDAISYKSQLHLASKPQPTSEIESLNALPKSTTKTLVERSPKLQHLQNTLKDDHACSSCSKIFGSVSDLQAHVSHSPSCSQSLLPCKLCEKTFNNVVSLKSHEQVHLKRKKIEGNPKTSYDHLTHMNGKIFKQTYNKPYSCTHCQKSFSILTYYEKHLKKHDTPQIYQCYLCAQSFNKQCDLVHHFASHNSTGSSYPTEHTIKFSPEVAPPKVNTNGNTVLYLVHPEQPTVYSSGVSPKINGNGSSPVYFVHPKCNTSVEGDKVKNHCYICALSFNNSHDLVKHLASHKLIRTAVPKKCDQALSDSIRNKQNGVGVPKVNEVFASETKTGKICVLQSCKPKDTAEEPLEIFFDAAYQGFTEPETIAENNLNSHSPKDLIMIKMNNSLYHETKTNYRESGETELFLETLQTPNLTKEIDSCKENIQGIVYAGDKFKPTKIDYNELCPLQDSPLAFIL